MWTVQCSAQFSHKFSCIAMIDHSESMTFVDVVWDCGLSKVAWTGFLIQSYLLKSLKSIKEIGIISVLGSL